MYNAHRGMVPQGGPNTRLSELLDQIRAEFDQEARRSVDYENQSEFVCAVLMDVVFCIRRVLCISALSLSSDCYVHTLSNPNA